MMTARDFTAVGYFFGRQLHQELKVPIGLLHSSWGGTGVATWTRSEAIASVPEIQAQVDAKVKQLEAPC